MQIYASSQQKIVIVFGTTHTVLGSPVLNE